MYYRNFGQKKLDLKEEAAYMEAAIAGDAYAREKLILHHVFVTKQIVYELIKGRRLNQEDIEDELSDAYIILIECIDYMICRKYQYNIEYIRKYIRSKIISSFRKKKYGINNDANLDDFEEFLSDSKDKIKSIENLVLLESLTDCLDDDEKNLLYMRYFEGLNQEEIASRLGIKQCTVSVKIKAIIEKIRQNANITIE